MLTALQKSPCPPSDSKNSESHKMRRLEKLRAKHNNVRKETGAELANSKERLVREKMAKVQGLNWYSQRFNESGRMFFMDTSDAGGKASDSRSNRESVAKKMPLEKHAKEQNSVKKETATEQAKSKERLVRERMAQSQDLNWYSQRFNESGRRFYMDAFDTGGKAPDESTNKATAKKVPLHVKLKKENKMLRRKLEKTESDRNLLKQMVSKVGAPGLSTDKAILKTKLFEAKAQYTTLELELSETKNELSQKETSTVELMEKMKQMKEAYDALERQMQSQRGSFSTVTQTITEKGDIEELQAEVNNLKHENRRLLLEKEFSMRHTRLGPISESPLNGSQAKLSTTTVDLTNAEMKVFETAEELKDTQDALDNAQSLIEKLRREKEGLAKKMENRLERAKMSILNENNGSRIDSTQRSARDRSQQSTHSPRRISRGLSMVLNEGANGVKFGKNTTIKYLSGADSSVSSLQEFDSSLSSHAQEESEDDSETPETQKKLSGATLNHDGHALNGQDLNIVNQTSIVSTSLLLICGFPLLALAFSVGSILLFGFQKDRSLPFPKDAQKYFLINCTGAIMSFGSWSLRLQAMEDPSRTLRFVFAALVREFSGFILAWFIYTDYSSNYSETEVIDLIEVKLKIFGGKNLVAKDRNIFGKATSSDPYVRIYHARNYIGKTRIKWKTLNPIWNMASFTIIAFPSELEKYDEVICQIYDHDTLSADDSMGTVIVPIPFFFHEKVRKWYPVTNGFGKNYCKNASGHLDVEIVVESLASKESMSKLGRQGCIRKGHMSLQADGKSEKKREQADKEGKQSFGEITAENKVQAAPDDAIVVKI